MSWLPRLFHDLIHVVPSLPVRSLHAGRVRTLPPCYGGGRSPTKPGAFTVNPWKAPTVSSVTPTSRLVNTTFSFSVSGSNFQPYSTVNFTNATYGNITMVVGTITPTKMTGSVTIPYNVPPGKFDILVTVPDGRNATKKGAFTVKGWSKPTVSSINPTKGTHGTTLNYTISGTNFQPGSTVTFTNSSAAGLNFTAAVTSIVPAKITGSVSFPAGRIGKYSIEVLCPDGKMASKSNAFTIM